MTEDQKARREQFEKAIHQMAEIANEHGILFSAVSHQPDQMLRAGGGQNSTPMTPLDYLNAYATIAAHAERVAMVTIYEMAKASGKSEAEIAEIVTPLPYAFMHAIAMNRTSDTSREEYHYKTENRERPGGGS
jgi:hypothetical protein